uniref:Uncharacterized protein n=1 Tax=Panagrolaimus davidi TaxID=227884 RepID=A0A914Q8B5_9BILA
MFTSIINSLINKSATHNDPELQQFAEQMKSFTSLFDSINQSIEKQFNQFDIKLNEKLDRLKPPQASKDEYIKSAQHEIAEKERARSFVISGVAEAHFPQSTQRNDYDYGKVCELLDFLHIEAKPITVYRIGAKGSRPRVTKVVMPASLFQRLVFKNSRALRQHPNAYVRQNIFIRPSLTKEQRVKTELQQKQVKYLNTKKNIYCIYAGKISIKSIADERGRRPKPQAVSDVELQELLIEFDANTTPINPRRGVGNGDCENFSMDGEEAML